MKTSITNLFATALLMVALSSATLIANATGNKASYTALTQVKNISKIVVTGNVKLILVQDAKEGVEIYDQYYGKNALVQQQGAELRISSFEKDPLTVIAHINNLSSIEASNTSSVTTAGNFNLLNLKVVLNDMATAEITSNTINLSTEVKDASSLILKGSTENHIAIVGSDSRMAMGEFDAQETSTKVAVKPVLVRNNQSRYEDLKVELLEKFF